MRFLIGAVFSWFVCMGQVQARDSDVDLLLEGVAMAKLMQSAEMQSEIFALPRPRGLIDTIEGIKRNINNFIEAFLATFDTNGNGRIDPGPELENFKKTLNDVALMLLDSDNDGKIEAGEVTAIAEQVINQFKGDIEERVCTVVILEAQKWGAYIKFNPLLNAAYKLCIGDRL
jgi:hypothetical protein